MLIALLVLAVVPFIILSAYNHPVGVDDWDYLGNCYLPDQGLFAKQLVFYRSWTGRYAATFLLSLLSFWGTIVAFKALPILFLLLLFTALYYFVGALLGPGATGSGQLGISLGILALYLSNLTGVYESLYFITYLFNGQLGILATIAATGALVRLLSVDRFSTGHFFATSGLIVLANGCYEMSLIALNLILLLGAVYWVRSAARNNSVRLWFFFVAFSCCLGGASLLAPGNFTRMEGYAGSGNPVQALLLATGSLSYLLVKWISNPQLLVGALLIVFCLPAGKKPANQLLTWKPLPIAASLLLILFISLVFSFLAVGSASFPERLEDLLYLEFLLGICWICLSVVYRSLEKRRLFSLPGLTFMLGGVFSMSLYCQGLAINRDLAKPKGFNLIELSQYFETENNIAKAWREVLTGRAAEYDRFMFRVYDRLISARTERVELTPPPSFPVFIYDELHDRKAGPGEPCMGKYFNLQVDSVFWAD